MDAPKNPPLRDREAERVARLAASLRENLKRRKAQQRDRTKFNEDDTGANPTIASDRNRDQPVD